MAGGINMAGVGGRAYHDGALTPKSPLTPAPNMDDRPALAHLIKGLHGLTDSAVELEGRAQSLADYVMGREEPGSTMASPGKPEPTCLAHDMALVLQRLSAALGSARHALDRLELSIRE